MKYFDEKIISKNIRLVRDENDKLFVKKTISPESAEIYKKLQNINNSYIIRIYDILTDENGSFEVIEEYVDGLSLYDIAMKRKFTCSEIKMYALELCSGLKILHQNNIIHRDITYSNVLLSRYGEIKIIDFDISRSYKKDGKADTTILGTPGFAAPEQYGFYQSSQLTDIYAVGSIMDFMLESTDDDTVLKKGLAFIAAKCMKFSPIERFKNVKDLENALKNLTAASPFANILKTLRFAYYILVFFTMVFPLFFTHFTADTIVFIAEFTAIMIFPIALWGNEFDWQRKFPELKYAKKPVKFFFMFTINLFVFMCVIILETIKSMSR